MDRTDVANVLIPLSENYGNRFELSHEQVQLWATVLAPFPVDLVERAVYRHLYTSPHPPTISDMRLHLAGEAGVLPPSAADALDSIRRGVALHPAVARAKQAVGTDFDWRQGDWSVLSGLFMKAYRGSEEALHDEVLLDDTAILNGWARELEAERRPQLEAGPQPLAEVATISEEFDEAWSDEDSAVHRQVFAEIVPSVLGKNRTMSQWQVELAERAADPQAFRERLAGTIASIEEAVAVRLDELREGQPPRVPPRPDPSPRQARYLVQASWREIIRGGLMIEKATKESRFMSYDAAIERAVQVVRENSRDPVLIDLQATVSEQRMEVVPGERKKDEPELRPVGVKNLVCTVYPDGISQAVPYAQLVPLPPVPMQLSEEELDF